MTQYPSFTGKQLVSLLKKKGFLAIRQKGSHVCMQHPDGRATVVPVHSGETIGPGLLASDYLTCIFQLPNFCPSDYCTFLF